MGCCESKTAEETPPPPPQPPPSPPAAVERPLPQPQPPWPPVRPAQTQSLTLENCIHLFQTIEKEAIDVLVDYVIDLIDEKLQSLLSQSSTSSDLFSGSPKGRAELVWSSLLRSGTTFLQFLNANIKLDMGDERRVQDVAQVLDDMGKVHWAIGGLSIIAFLLQEIRQVSEINQAECIELLRQLAELAGRIKLLNYDKPEEEKVLRGAITIIVEGSMLCASQLMSRDLFSSLKASVDSISLVALQLRIKQFYTGVKPEQGVVSPPWDPIYPDYAVGMEGQKKQVIKLLDIGGRDKSPLVAVVIYGSAGIGKTTLATAVIADLDLTGYNYSGVQIQKIRSRNNIRVIQGQILKDAFPAYYFNSSAALGNSAEGRDHLTSAFEARGNKPVFLFIDNALRAEDLQELFPRWLAGLPKGSRILITTRDLRETNMLKDAGLERRQHGVVSLPQQEATRILLKDFSPPDSKHMENVRKALQICAGIPLVLEIVGAHLRKHNYTGDKCKKMFRDLERTNEDSRIQTAVALVCKELEPSTQEAFFDICCFFFNSWRRRDVEYIVGADQMAHLEKAALIKTSRQEKMIVHDIIQEEGLSTSEPSRIVDMQSWLQVVNDDQRLGQIKGVWLSGEDSESGHELDERRIFSMKNSLRVLALGHKINVSRSSETIPQFGELRFLYLGGDISALWPPNLGSLQKLAVFHGPVFKDNMMTLYQLPKNLRLMKAAAQSRESPNVIPDSRLAQESANVEEFRPADVIQTSSLEELDLRELRNFNRFPERLDHLTALKVLILDEWDRMELPIQVCGLRSLYKLSICGGGSLKKLTESFGQLSGLEELILTSCKELRELPSTFGNLRSLKHLNLAQCVNLEKLPPSFGNLSSLEVLNLEKCRKLKELPCEFGSLGQLKKLSVQSEDLKKLPPTFGNLASLQELRCTSPELDELPDTFGQLNSLTNLDLSGCVKLKTLPSNIGGLRSLKAFNLFSLLRLEELSPNTGELPRLTHLDLRQCNSLKECPKLFVLSKGNQGLSIWLPDHLMAREFSSSSNQRLE